MTALQIWHKNNWVFYKHPHIGLGEFLLNLLPQLEQDSFTSSSGNEVKQWLSPPLILLWRLRELLFGTAMEES